MHEALISRRRCVLAAVLAAPSRWAFAMPGGNRTQAMRSGFAALEKRHGGRLGVATLDTATGALVSHRGNERFPMCSTFKFLAAALMLSRVDRGRESLARRVHFKREELVAYSPVTERHADADGMRIDELCAAAVTMSDNTAANLLLASFGGPAALTAYSRSLGDPVTRLDRTEPALNESRPFDPRDTTSPVAMLGLLRRTVLGDALSPPSRTQLGDWLVANQTGGKRLRAGVPESWRVGDKTGSGQRNATHDVALLWPPQGAPRIVAAYYLSAKADLAEREAVLADVGRLVTAV